MASQKELEYLIDFVNDKVKAFRLTETQVQQLISAVRKAALLGMRSPH